MRNVRSTTLHRRAPALALALFALAAVLWTTASAAACTHGYYRFTDTATTIPQNAVGPWSASHQDYQGPPPHGISFYMDLDGIVIMTMNIARAPTRRGSTSYVYMIPCNDLVPPLIYTPVRATPPSGHWSYARRDDHGVISTAAANGGGEFNRTPVTNMNANQYLLSKAQLVRQD